MYKILLVDLDNTLLDFDKAEDKALTKTLLKYGLNNTCKLKEEFKTINKYYWNQFEKGLISKEKLLEKRFIDFFGKYNCSINEAKVNKYYLNELANSGDLMEHAQEMLERIKGKVKIYPVTNGVYNTQKKRLALSGLNMYFEDVFISEKIGYQKPRKEFFDYVFEHINNPKKADVILLGDSLSADIIGGIEYNIDTCLYAPKKETLETKLYNEMHNKITYVINDLLEFEKIINKN